MQLIEKRLSNGIPVLFRDYESSVCSFYWWVQAGSADETPAEAGFAHFLEHMLFKDSGAKDTGKPSEGKMARALESLGADINAYTSFDQTVYHVTGPETFFEDIVEGFSTITQNRKFLKDDFEREREVIIEEMRRNNDSPDRQMFQSLFQATFAKHPYGKPVIGTEKIIKHAKLKNLEAFFEKHYTSARMGLIVVGPIGAKTGAKGGESLRMQKVFKTLERQFGEKVFSAKTAAKFASFADRTKRPHEPELRSNPYETYRPFAVQSPSFAFSFRVPDLKHEDTPAIDLAAGVLGSGDLSRLYQNLFYKQKLVTSISAGLYVPNDPGMMYINADLTDIKHLEDALSSSFEEIRKLKQDGPEDQELERLVVNAESEKLYALQTSDGIASRIGFLSFGVKNLGFDEQYVSQLKAASKDQVRDIARTYFTPERLGFVTLVPKEIAKAGFSKLSGFRKLAETLKSEDMTHAPEVAPKLAKASPSKSKSVKKGFSLEPEFFITKNGIRVSHFYRKNSPVFSVHGSTLGGLRGELLHPTFPNKKASGYGQLLGLTWTKGTEKRSATEVQKMIEGSASDLSAFSGRNSTGLSLTGLVKYSDKMLDLYREVLTEPSLPDEELEHSKRIALDAIKNQEDHASQVAGRLFLESLYESHPYGSSMLGTNETVNACNHRSLHTLFSSWVRPANLSIGISGGLPREQVQRFCDVIDQAVFNLSNKSKPIDHDKIQDPGPLVAPRWVEKKFGREQSHIFYGGFGAHISSFDRYTLQLLSMILGGQSGRLFIELREKKSLAYSVSPVQVDGIEKGYYSIYIGCGQGKEQESIEGIKKVMEDFVKKGLKKGELERAHATFLGRRAMDLQSESSIASHLSLNSLYHGRPEDAAMTEAKVLKISPKDIIKAAEHMFIHSHCITSVAG